MDLATTLQTQVDRNPDLLSIGIRSDLGVLRVDTGHHDHNVHLPGHDAVGKVYCLSIGLDGDFAHRRADVWHAAMTLNQPSHIIGAATFQGGNVQPTKICVRLWHQIYGGGNKHFKAAL